MKYHVVILGGSYAGIAAMRQLSKYSHIQVTLIDQHPYHFLQTEGYELISGNTSFDETIVSLPALCANYENTTFKHHIVTAINPTDKIILLKDAKIHYDTLIIALGSVTKHFNANHKVSNYSSGAKSLRGAFKLNLFFQHELYQRLESSKQSKENFNIIIGGAGLSGVEIAAGMQHFFNRYYRSNALSCATLHIHLIASRETILYGMHKRIIRISTQRLKKLRVKIHTHNKIQKIEEHKAILSDGKIIPFDFIIFAGGTSTPPCINSLDLEKNSKGKPVVNQYLQSPQDKNIYIIGDSTTLSNKKGQIQPPTAQTAIQSGKCAATNIMRILKHQKPKRANIQVKGLAIALGGRYAAIEIGNFIFTGYLAYLVKKLIERIYKWPLWWLVSKGYPKLDSCEI